MNTGIFRHVGMHFYIAAHAFIERYLLHLSFSLLEPKLHAEFPAPCQSRPTIFSVLSNLVDLDAV